MGRLGRGPARRVEVRRAVPRPYNRAPVSTFPPVPEQMDLLLKGVEACEKKEELEKKLARSLKTGKPLRVKVGFDPSAPDLHLGHTVVFRKMRHFQELGHEVVFLIGDFTGMIGDPTGKKATRPQLTKDEILANAETYKAQVFKILDPVKTRVMFNSEWLSALGAEGLVRLCAKYTVAQLLERDDFAKRFKEQKPIAVHELLYPLCQGYDSVALDADVELGGTDQLFNLLVGRELMRGWDKEPQCVLTLPLLVGTDGVEKMSKSLNNAIGVTEPPNEIFGKVMSVSDAAMWAYWTLLTDRRPAEIEEMKAAVAGGTLHPKKLKMDLGLQIVSDFHGQAAAFAAQEEFEKRFAGAGGAVSAEEMSLGSLFPGEENSLERGIADLLVATALAPSKNVARQKVKEGAVSTSRGWPGLDEDRVAGRNLQVSRRRPFPPPRKKIREGQTVTKRGAGAGGAAAPPAPAGAARCAAQGPPPRRRRRADGPPSRAVLPEEGLSRPHLGSGGTRAGLSVRGPRRGRDGRRRLRRRVARSRRARSRGSPRAVAARPRLRHREPQDAAPAALRARAQGRRRDRVDAPDVRAVRAVPGKRLPRPRLRRRGGGRRAWRGSSRARG